MRERSSGVWKMLLETAETDRQLRLFPQASVPNASPYSQSNFSDDVIKACKDKIGCHGLKISKAIFVGDVGVGKTSVVNRFCHKVFDSNYKATIGVDFEVERFDILGVPFNLQIWDTAGQERFRSIAASYYRGAQTVVVVFDMTSLLSLSHCQQWLHDALQCNRGKPRIFLVGTKIDLISEATRQQMELEATREAKKMGAEFCPVSSKTGANVENLFFRIASLSFEDSIVRELEYVESRTHTVGNNLVTLCHEPVSKAVKVKNKHRCIGGNSCAK